jgi:hypothetical protein
MVRCEEFYQQWKKKGNFCGKSEMVAKKVEEYIDYVQRNKIGNFKISHCALDPFISIENLNEGRVHYLAIRELKNSLKKGKVRPEKITRRFSIEMINKANTRVGEAYKLDHIPGIRKRMGDHEHEIGEVGYEVRSMFDVLKKDITAKNNNELLKIMLEVCIKFPDEVRKIKEELDEKEKAGIEIVSTI